MYLFNFSPSFPPYIEGWVGGGGRNGWHQFDEVKLFCYLIGASAASILAARLVIAPYLLAFSSDCGSKFANFG